MSFLLPLFLLGAFAVTLPVIFHLIRRSTRHRTRFSSLMFLLASPPRLTRRSRLEHLLLLALRCLVLCLIAFAFARPFVRRPVSERPAATAPRRLAILVDSSASMRRANLWPDALGRAEALLRQTSPVDQVSLFTFDQGLKPVVTLEEWNAAPAEQRVALGIGKLRELSPGWSATHLGNALIGAAESLAEPAGQIVGSARQVILISDLQEGARLDQLQGYEWPKGVQLRVETAKPRSQNNASLQLVAESAENDTKAAENVRVRVTNSGESRREQFRVGWALAEGRSFVGIPMEVYVPAGQSRVVALPVPASNPPTAGPPPRIVLEGDDEPFDNSIYVIPPEPVRLKLFYFGSDSEQDTRQPRFFLQRAFQSTRRQQVQVVSGEPLPSPAELSRAGLLVITASLSDEQIRALHDSVVEGQSALFLLKDIGSGATLARLLGQQRIELQEAQVPNYAMLGEIDFQHPLFSGFADPRFSDFTRIHFWKYRKLDAATLTGTRVLAKFDNGDPALLETPVGRGRIFTLTSGWYPADSQLALSTKFVPLLYSLLELAGRSSTPPTQYHVDDAVALDGGGTVSGKSVVTPSGQRISLGDNQNKFTQTAGPGIYRVETPEHPYAFAVNLDPAESRTAPLSADELERLGAPMAVQLSAEAESVRQVRLHNDELEARQKLWRWVLAVTVGVLLVETWFSGRTARRSARPAAG